MSSENNNTRSILAEINSYVKVDGKRRIIDARATHAIEATINVIRLIEEAYPPEEADALIKSMVGSIKNKNAGKFSKAIKKASE